MVIIVSENNYLIYREYYSRTLIIFNPNTQPNAHRLVDVDPYLKWGN